MTHSIGIANGKGQITIDGEHTEFDTLAKVLRAARDEIETRPEVARSLISLACTLERLRSMAEEWLRHQPRHWWQRAEPKWRSHQSGLEPFIERLRGNT